MKSYLKALENVDYLLISSPSNVRFLTKYSGFSEIERECYLIMSKNKKYLITDRRYSEALKTICPNYEIVDIGIGKFLNNEKRLGKFKNARIGFEETSLNVFEYKKLRKFLKLEPVDISSIRTIKENAEILEIKKACSLADKALRFIHLKLKVGVTEKEVSNFIEDFFRKNGATSSFAPIVAFGANSSIPHHLTGKTKLKNNMSVLIDIGAKVNGYCSDTTRTFFFGKPKAEWVKMYETVVNAQKEAAKLVKPGIKAKELDAKAREFITSNGYPDIIHSVGHGIGIEVHEAPHLSPNSKDVLKEGMVFSIEPGIYIPKTGGIRIEDLYQVTKNGARKLTLSPASFIVI